MKILKRIFEVLTDRERLIFMATALVFVLTSISRITLAVQESGEWVPIAGGSYREGVVGQPVAINPVISENEADLDISRLVYDNLADLIESYDVTDNGRVYALKLKEGLTWQNGKPLTSDDVIFTIETIQNPDSRSPLKTDWQGVVAERTSELRINIVLPASFVFFKKNLDRLPVIPAHIFGNIPAANLRLSNYNLEPIGSGPYVFESLIKRKDGFVTEIVLKANDEYHGQKPFIKTFHFIFYQTNEAALKDLALRKLDGFGSLMPLDVRDLSSKLAVNRVSAPNYYAVFMNPNVNPLLNEKDFRLALASAINKNKIAEEIFKNDQAEMVSGPLGKWGERDETAVYDQAAAKKTIESIKKNKIELTLIVPKIDFLEKTASLIKEDWLAAGIDTVNIRILNPNELIENVIKKNNYELVIFGNILKNPIDLFPFWHSSQRFYPGLNLSLYKNSKVDALTEKVRQTEDNDLRQKTALQAEKLILNDAPAIFLFSLPYTYIHTKDLRGIAFENPEKLIISPAERFDNVNRWFVEKARILKN